MYTVPALWQSLSDVGDARAYRHVETWRRAADSLRTQKERLQACREALVRRWPPERSPASAAFVARLDELAGSMVEAEHAAVSTMHRLMGVLDALGEARTRLEPVYRAYVEKSTDATPRFWDREEDRLNEQARTIMVDAESRV
ncbi:MAG TPA: hypothetical protein VFY17_05745, partial [Pilimelia sp.]|nr:hypothetical protein [Pilimelia sp.]